MPKTVDQVHHKAPDKHFTRPLTAYDMGKYLFSVTIF